MVMITSAIIKLSFLSLQLMFSLTAATATAMPTAFITVITATATKTIILTVITIIT